MARGGESQPAPRIVLKAIVVTVMGGLAIGAFGATVFIVFVCCRFHVCFVCGGVGLPQRSVVLLRECTDAHCVSGSVYHTFRYSNRKGQGVCVCVVPGGPGLPFTSPLRVPSLFPRDRTAVVVLRPPV